MKLRIQGQEDFASNGEATNTFSAWDTVAPTVRKTMKTSWQGTLKRESLMEHGMIPSMPLKLVNVVWQQGTVVKML